LANDAALPPTILGFVASSVIADDDVSERSMLVLQYYTDDERQKRSDAACNAMMLWKRFFGSWVVTIKETVTIARIRQCGMVYGSLQYWWYPTSFPSLQQCDDVVV
jgi:hypothetical protein